MFNKTKDVNNSLQFQLFCDFKTLDMNLIKFYTKQLFFAVLTGRKLERCNFYFYHDRYHMA